MSSVSGKGNTATTGGKPSTGNGTGTNTTNGGIASIGGHSNGTGSVTNPSGGSAANVSVAGKAGMTAAAGQFGGLGGLGGLGGAGGTSLTTMAGTSSIGAGGWAGTLEVGTTPALPWCVGTNYAAQLSATLNGSGGGGPTYHWQYRTPIADMVLGTSTGPTIALTGTPKVAGIYPAAVSVEDELGRNGSIDLTIVDAPAITTPQVLRDGCLGEVYTLALAATGPNINSLKWEASLPDALGLTLSPSGQLNGVLAKTGEFQFDVTVRDTVTNCTATTQRFTLTVNGDASKLCPKIRIFNEPAVAPAPASCRSWPYSARFEVIDGTAPYTWSIVDPPAGFDFNPVTQALTGNPAADAKATLQVTETTGLNRSYRRSFAIPLREKCWFAYLSPESNLNRIQLFDPLLGARLQRPASTVTDRSVVDFKFSPDGKFLAYRVKNADQSHSLWLWQAPEWNRELELPLSGSVTHYAWSADSGVLAAAMKSGSDTLLGGVNVKEVPASSPVGTIQNFQTLTAVSAPVDSDPTADAELQWYGRDGSEYVAFYSPDDPDYPEQDLYFAKYGASGFPSWELAEHWFYQKPLFLYPSQTGFFVLQAEDAALKYFARDTVGPVYHGSVAVAPSATFVARSDNRQLQIFRAQNPSFLPTDAPWKSASGCDNLLTWARQTERIACIDAANTRLNLFDIDSAGGVITPGTISNSAAFASSSWAGFRRLFSPSGSYLALATSTQLYWASVGTMTPTIVWSSGFPEPYSEIDMSFSPDETLFALLGKHVLRIYHPAVEGSLSTEIGTLQLAASPCSETPLAMPTWCGSDRAARRFVWSPNSDLVAFVSNDGSLFIQNLRIRPISIISGGVTANSSCVGACIGGFQFQP